MSNNAAEYEALLHRLRITISLGIRWLAVREDSELVINQVQKILYAVLITSRKLVHYFQAHPILVVTSFPIGDILHNRDATGRIAKWAVELRSFELSFQPQMAIKSQALINFIAEWTETQTPVITEKLEY